MGPKTDELPADLNRWIKTQCIVSIYSSLRRKDCSFIKHDHTQSFC